METINVSIDKKVWDQFKEYCDRYNHRYAAQLTTVVKEHLEWIDDPYRKAKGTYKEKK